MATTVFTTLSAAIDNTQTSFAVASATGITAKANGAATTYLYVDFELMAVESISGTSVTVKRGISPTQATAHLISSKVWVGPPSLFLNGDPAGAVSATASGVWNPSIVPKTRTIWDIVGGMWVESERLIQSTAVNVGAAATGVTAVEYGDAINHQTKLTFTALGVITPVALANLAGGVLLYTFPAGAIMVDSANLSVALADVSAGALCVADTPEIGVGLLVGSGAQATLNAVGATAHNYIAAAAVAGCAAAYTDIKLSESVARVALPAATAHIVNLNAADGWAGAGTIKATGTVILNWIYSGV